MHASRAKGSRNLQAELNVTPLIDVMRVLPIIFMVALPMLTRTVMSDSRPGDSALATQQKPIRLCLDAKGRIALNDQAMAGRLRLAPLASKQNPQPLARIEIADVPAIKTLRH